MGWLSFLQHSEPRPGLLKEARQSRRLWWHVYLDNFAAGQVIGPEEQTLAGDALHERAEKAWKNANVLSLEKKRQAGIPQGEELGAYIDGVTGTIGPSGMRLLKTVQATLWILRTGQLNKKHLQVVVGRWVHILQFRRPGMSFLEKAWEYIHAKKFNARLLLEARRELVAICCSACLLHANLKAGVSQFTTASDASMTGGAVGISHTLNSCRKRLFPGSAALPQHRASNPSVGTISV